MPDAFSPQSVPEAQGILSASILTFVDAVDRDVRDLDSLLLLRQGAVVAEGHSQP